MSKMFMDIHLEYCDDNGERLSEIIASGKPFNISIVPVLLVPTHRVFRKGIYPSGYYYPKGIVELLKECARIPDVSIGQQGFSHYCPNCFSTKDKTDPWHENACLYGNRKSLERQIDFMNKGKKVIENIIGLSPIVYSPPNHQFDDNSIEAAAKLRYGYFTERGIVSISPYRENGITILPQRKIGQTGEIFYTHYDQIPKNKKAFDKIIKNSVALDELTIDNKSPIVSFINRQFVFLKKRLRDFMK